MVAGPQAMLTLNEYDRTLIKEMEARIDNVILNTVDTNLVRILNVPKLPTRVENQLRRMYETAGWGFVGFSSHTTNAGTDRSATTYSIDLYKVAPEIRSTSPSEDDILRAKALVDKVLPDPMFDEKNKQHQSREINDIGDMSMDDIHSVGNHNARPSPEYPSLTRSNKGNF